MLAALMEKSNRVGLGFVELEGVVALVTLIEDALVGTIRALVTHIDEGAGLVARNLDQRVRHQRVEGFEVVGEHGKANHQIKHGAAFHEQIAVLETVPAPSVPATVLS